MNARDMTLVKSWNHYNISIQKLMSLIILIDFLKFYYKIVHGQTPHKSIKHWIHVTCNSDQTYRHQMSWQNSSLCFCSPTHNELGNRNELDCCVPEVITRVKTFAVLKKMHWVVIQAKWIPSWSVQWVWCSELEARGPDSCSVFKHASDLTVRP